MRAPGWASWKDAASFSKASWREAAAKTVTSPVMSAPAEAPWAPAAGVSGFVESEAPPHATSEAAETSET